MSVPELIKIAPGTTEAERCGLVARLVRDLAANQRPLEVPKVRPAVTKDPHAFNVKGRIENVVIADLHEPIARRDIIREISKKHDGARLIVAGDILDFASFSKFSRVKTCRSRQEEWNMSALRVLQDTAGFLDEISDYYSEIVVIRGNHDARPNKAIASVAGADAAEFTDYLFTNELGKARKVVIPNRTNLDYYAIKIGDMWVGHWHWYGKLPAAGVRQVIDEFLPDPAVRQYGECNVVVQAHTHRTHDGSWRYKRAIECGAMCKRPDYVDTNFGKGGTPQLGYALIVQDDGYTDWQASGGVKLNPEWSVRDLNGRSLDEITS